ncbi:MAG: hypothetical protein ACRERV_13110, partial [Methylococcales bacterium]
MIFIALSFACGVVFLQQMARLPEPGWAIPALMIAAIGFRFRKWRLLGFFASGWVWALLWANLVLNDRLDPAIEGLDLLIEGRLDGLVQSSEQTVRFG